MFRDSYVLCVYVMDILCTFHTSELWLWYNMPVIIKQPKGICFCDYICIKHTQTWVSIQCVAVVFHSNNAYIPQSVGGCRIHRLNHYRGIRLPNKCPGYDNKQSDGEVPVMLELWGMQSTPSLPLLPMVAPERVLSMGQIELNCALILNWIAWNRTIGI